MNDAHYLGDKEDILERIVGSDAMVSDFDGTDVKTPLKRAAEKFCVNPINILRHPKLILWAEEAMVRKLIEGKDADSPLWKKLVDCVGEDISKIKGYAEDDVIKSLSGDEMSYARLILPGVPDIYSQMGEKEKFYLTRNFDSVVRPFADILGIPEENIYSDDTDKARNAERLIQDNAGRVSRYVFRGDSCSDSEVLDVADFYKSKRVIDDYVGVAIGKPGKRDLSKVSVMVGDDQRPLAEDLSDVVDADSENTYAAAEAKVSNY